MLVVTKYPNSPDISGQRGMCQMRRNYKACAKRGEITTSNPSCPRWLKRVDDMFESWGPKRLRITARLEDRATITETLHMFPYRVVAWNAMQLPLASHPAHRGWGGIVMHGRSLMAIDPRITTMPERSTSCFHRPGRHCLHQARSGEVFGVSHEGWAASYSSKNHFWGGPSCRRMTASNQLIFVPVWPLPMSAMGVICNCLVGAILYIHTAWYDRCHLIRFKKIVLYQPT